METAVLENFMDCCLGPKMFFKHLLALGSQALDPDSPIPEPVSLSVG